MKLDNLSVTINDKKLLDGICAELTSDCECIIGANGAGKSTLVNSIIEKTSYQGIISDLDNYSYAGSVDEMSTDLSVNEILEYSVTYSGKSDISLEEILEEFELKYFEHQPFNHLSGGERQRVNLACSLYQSSKVVIWDEPTNYLDPKHIRDLVRIVNKLKKYRKFLIVSHNLNFILAVSSKVLGLKCGQLIYHEFSEDCFERKLFDEVFDMPFRYLIEEEQRMVF